MIYLRKKVSGRETDREKAIFITPLNPLFVLSAITDLTDCLSSVSLFPFRCFSSHLLSPSARTYAVLSFTFRYRLRSRVCGQFRSCCSRGRRSIRNYFARLTFFDSSCLPSPRSLFSFILRILSSVFSFEPHLCNP